MVLLFYYQLNLWKLIIKNSDKTLIQIQINRKNPTNKEKEIKTIEQLITLIFVALNRKIYSIN